MFISTPPPPPPKPIIVWVHGTRPSSFMPWVEMNQALKEKVDSLSQTPKGLHPLDALDHEGRTHKLLTALSQANPEQFPLESIYAFGWSGDLDGPERKKSAGRLYASLGELTALYKRDYGIAPPIILLSHSHGGNVILNMAPFYQQHDDVKIVKNIMLACPVQKDTAGWVATPLFGNTYSLHSHVDLVQIMDPQRLQPYREAFLQWQESKSLTPIREAYLLSMAQPLFSERHFPASSRLIQANICWNTAQSNGEPPLIPPNKFENFINKAVNYLIKQKRGVLHSEFITPKFMQHLPALITKLDERITAGTVPANDIDLLI